MKLIIEIPEEIYKSCKAIYKLPVKKEVADAYTYAIANGNAYTYPIANGTPLKKEYDISQMMWEIYMEGVNMAGEYQGCWVRFKDIEKIVDKYVKGER